MALSTLSLGSSSLGIFDLFILFLLAVTCLQRYHGPTMQKMVLKIFYGQGCEI